LWEGAKIDLNWKSGWSLNKNSTLTRDQDGNIFVSSISASGTITRSFFTMPPVLFLSVFKSGIKQVAELYNPRIQMLIYHMHLFKDLKAYRYFANFGFLRRFC
jgi:hypothetical protein